MFNNNFVFALLLCNYCRAIRAQSLAAPVILSVLNVHVILLFQANKPDDILVTGSENRKKLLTYHVSARHNGPRFFTGVVKCYHIRLIEGDGDLTREWFHATGTSSHTHTHSDRASVHKMIVVKLFTSSP